jgi:STE24 endopeptidase
VRAPSRRAVLGPALLAAVAAELGARLLAPRERPPEPAEVDLREYFSSAEIERGARYARPQLAIGLSRSALQLGLLAAAAAHARRRPSAGTGEPPLRRAAEGAAAAVVLGVGSSAAGLPLSALARRRSLRVGLATQSWRGWAGDVAKATAIESVFAALAGGAVVALSDRYPRDWWRPAAAGSVALGALLSALAPVLLDPVFNDFTPLPEGEVRRDVLELAAAAGVRVGEVYSVDASRRTTAANAYVTGLGPTKRVVLFDTLLDRYSRQEVRTVVAHELAHVRHRDVARSIVYAAIVSGPLALATQRLSTALVPEQTGAPALPGLALAAAVVAAPVGLIANRLSRAIERRADAFAIALSGEPDAFISFERTIALQNVADLDPPEWVTRLLSTHPSTAERIGAAVAGRPS